MSYLVQNLPPRQVDRIEDPSLYTTEEIIGNYIKLLYRMAYNKSKRSKNGTPLVEDLVSEGILGLLDALERWDPARNRKPNAFHNLAVIRINYYMHNFIGKEINPDCPQQGYRDALCCLDKLRRLLKPYPNDDLLALLPPEESHQLPEEVRDQALYLKTMMMRHIGQNDNWQRALEYIGSSPMPEPEQKTLERQLEEKIAISRFLSRPPSQKSKELLSRRLAGELREDIARDLEIAPHVVSTIWSNYAKKISREYYRPL